MGSLEALSNIFKILGQGYPTLLQHLKPAPTSVLLYHQTLAEGYLAVGWTNLSEDPRDKEVTESFWNQKGFTAKALQAFRFFPMKLYRVTRDAIEPLGSFPSRKEWLHTS